MSTPKRIRETRVTLRSYVNGDALGKYKVFWWPAALGYRVVGLDNSVDTIVYPSDVRGLLTANNIAAKAAS